MMFPAFLFETVLLSLSGVMAPGSVTAVTVGKGSESPHAGALIAVGHGIIEFPLMISLYFGSGYFLQQQSVKGTIALVGGAFLAVMAVSMFGSIRKSELAHGRYIHSPVAAGFLLSIANPYFIVWWATVGAALVMRSTTFGVTGFVLFAILHWLCDFVWYYFLSALSFRGGRFFGQGFQKAVFAICGTALLFFAGKFVVDGIKIFS